MTATTAGSTITGISALPLHCRACGFEQDAAPVAICEACLGPLEPRYPVDRVYPGRDELATRERSMWRYREWLPFAGGDALSGETGFTPLIHSPALAKRLGVETVYLKNDAASYPSFSFKDRVVAVACRAAAAFGLTELDCASTGNLANAVAARAAADGFRAWIFIPDNLEEAKIVGTAIYGANVVRVRGTYDDVNRLCTQLADRFGWGIVNINLRSYYGEGSKTMAFETADQRHWRLPTAVVAPMAGGSLVTKLHKGFGEVIAAGLSHDPLPRLYGAQAAGCAPIVRLVERGEGQIIPEIPNTIARSLAIGNPADGAFAANAIRATGGWAAAVSDEEIVAGIRVLAESTGIFAETAGNVTVAAAVALAAAGRFNPQDEVVLCITGNGLKTVDAVRDALPAIPVVNAKVREVADLVQSRRLS